MMKKIMIYLLIMVVLSLPTVGVEMDITKADQPIPFHVPDEQFEPVEPAPWVYDCVLKVFIGLAHDSDVVIKMIDEAAGRGVQAVHTGGLAVCYPLRKDDPSAPGTPADLDARVRSIIKTAKSHGMRVAMGVDPFAPVEMVKAHPEWMIWREPDFDTEAALAKDLTLFENQGIRCLNLASPFGEYYADGIAELMAEYGFDAVSFDGNYHPFLDYSPYNQAMFTKETGLAFPKTADMNDIVYRQYMLWADGKLEVFYRQLHEKMRAVNPEAATYSWTTNSGRYGHLIMVPRVMSQRMNLLMDCPVQEWWLDETNIGASVVAPFGAALVRAANGGRVGACEPYLLSHGNPYGVDSIPEFEVVARAMQAITNGAVCAFNYVQPAVSGVPEVPLAAIRERARWLRRTESLSWAAILVSDQTRQFYAYRDPIGNSVAHALGVFRAAMEEHLPATLITDWDLRPATLAKYKVLILPNAACLSQRQVEVIREYVHNGGGLVASCETSLLDEIGRPRGDFALSDLFGTHYEGRPAAAIQRPELDVNFAVALDDSYWAARQGVAALRFGDAVTRELVDDPELKKLVPGGQVNTKGTLVRISPPTAPMAQAMVYFPEGIRDCYPAAVMGQQTGYGRVVYFAAGIDAGYFNYSYPAQRRLLARAIEWAASSPAPVRVEAPMCIQAGYYTQKDDKGERLVIHLFNGVSTTAGHGLPSVEIPMREEALPVYGVRVTMDDPAITRVHAEPGAMELPIRRDGKSVTVTVPPIELHMLVVAEK